MQLVHQRLVYVDALRSSSLGDYFLKSADGVVNNKKVQGQEEGTKREVIFFACLETRRGRVCEGPGGDRSDRDWQLYKLRTHIPPPAPKARPMVRPIFILMEDPFPPARATRNFLPPFEEPPAFIVVLREASSRWRADSVAKRPREGSKFMD